MAMDPTITERLFSHLELPLLSGYGCKGQQSRLAAIDPFNVSTGGANMAHYIDGFVFPISRDRLDEYKQLVETAAEIWKEHGALDYREYVGNDLLLEGTRAFTDLLAASEGEAIVFGWVEFDSREARDLANKKVAADPRMVELMNSSNSGFDAERMAYGGFESFVLSSKASAGSS